MPGVDDLAEIERRAWDVVDGAPAHVAVRALCGALGGVNAAASLIDTATGRGVAEGFAEMDPVLTARLARDFASPATNPLLACMPRLPFDRFLHAAEGLDLSRVRRTRFHAEWWVPTGVRDHAGVIVMPAVDGRFAFVAIGCLGARDWFDAPERRFAGAAARSIALALRVVAGMDHARASAAIDGRDPDPCWLVSSDTTPLLSNRPARDVADAGRVVRGNGRRLTLADGDADRRLRHAVAAACVAGGTGASIALRAGRGFARLAVEPGPRYRDQRTALATLRAPRPMAWDVGDLRRAFGMTPREAEVALALAAGLRPAEVAVATGLAPGSVRLYLKRAYAKTGTDGQGPLIAKLLHGS